MLKLHGHDLRREVTSAGSVVFDVKNHPAPRGMPLAPHTFHGGDAPEDVAVAKGSEWWLIGDAAARDRAAMSEWFPDFHEIEGTEDAPPRWLGTLGDVSSPVEVVIVHAADRSLPRVLPMVDIPQKRVLRGRFRVTPHLFLNGSLCVASPEDWDPDRDTVAVVAGWAAHWLACYREFCKSGEWPTDGYLNHVAA